MAVEVLEKSREEVIALLEEAEESLIEIEGTLSTVEVLIPRTSVEVIKAIYSIFGKDYIKKDGSSVITYKMFNTVNRILRQAGKNHIKEVV